MPVLTVVDLSHHNESSDFAAAKAAGLVGVIHKATEGSSFVDADYARRRLDAEAAGLKWSSYHFLRHGGVPAQIKHYLATVEPDEGERVCIDYEAEDCTLEDLREAIHEIREADPSLQITVYSGHLIKEQLGDAHDATLATTSLWIAQYTGAAAPDWPRGTWPVWSLWQYSDGAAGGSPKAMAGISKPHDCNAFNGTAANCAKWFGPAEDDAAESVEIAITAPPGVSVLVTVNGRPLEELEEG